MQRRTFLAVLASSVASTLRSASARAQSSPTWTRDAKDPRWVQGQVSAAATPDGVWNRLRRVPEWPRMFTDIKTLRITERVDDAHWRLKLETRTFDCGVHEYHVVFDGPTKTGPLWIDAPGVTAVAYMRVLDGATAESARVVYSLFVDARGFAGWFITRDELRRKQEAMVVRYLADLAHAFRVLSPSAEREAPNGAA